MKYQNTITGLTFETNCEVNGPNLRKVEEDQSPAKKTDDKPEEKKRRTRK